MRQVMLNDRTTPLSLLASRRSGRPREMVGPGPTDEQMALILTIGARTPDHGKLSPWRFVTISDDQRAAFSALMHRALSEEDPAATPAHHDKAEEFARQGAALIVVVSAPVPNHKIPVWEQQLSSGAAAMNILLAAHALGFVGGWITGWQAYSERVRDAFCAPGERIAGFVFLGHPGHPLEERPRPPLSAIARRWNPPAN
jgi:nitroreductase